MSVFRMLELQKSYLILVPPIYVCCPFRGDIYFREEHALPLFSLYYFTCVDIHHIIL